MSSKSSDLHKLPGIRTFSPHFKVLIIHIVSIVNADLVPKVCSWFLKLSTDLEDEMMNNKFLIGFLLIFAAAVSVVTFSTASAKPFGFGGGMFFAEHIAAELDLDETQRDAVDGLFEAAKDQAKPHVRSMIELREEMKTLAKGDFFDETQVRGVATRKAEIMTELMVIRMRTQFQMRELLSDTQAEKLEALMAERGPQGGRWR
ncbi:MAG: Spy/CpxP family protein refolding chaperone [Pseudomonadota bacterium]